MSITIAVRGHAATQGSKKAFKRGRQIVLVEMDTKLPAWRQAIADAAQATHGPDWEPMDGPLVAKLNVFLPAPAKSKFGSYPAGPPDLDKLIRAVGDALKIAGTITDDARIVRWQAEKHWAADFTGAIITIHPKVEQ